MVAGTGQSSLVRDLQTGKNLELDGNGYVSFSSDRRFAVFTAEGPWPTSTSVIRPQVISGVSRIYVADLALNKTQIISIGLADTPANEHSFDPWISGDGRYIAFWSRASNLVENDTNNVPDIFLAPNPLFSIGMPETIGIFRPSAATFYERFSNTTGFADREVGFGASTDLPIAGDWDGDGIDTVGVYRPSTAQFFLTNAQVAPYTVDYSFVYGIPNDTPLVGDWNGDGKDGVGVFRPSNGLLYLTDSLATGFASYTMVLGVPGDVGVAGNWDGDGKDSPGVYRPTNQVFYLTNQLCNCSVYADAQSVLGIAGDVPFTGDWNGDGITGLGVFRPSNSLTYLKDDPTISGFADIQLVYGSNNDKPIAGRWTLFAAAAAQTESAPAFMPNTAR
jgi:hypothetical protein